MTCIGKEIGFYKPTEGKRFINGFSCEVSLTKMSALIKHTSYIKV
jgi:hypothetical protein